MDETESKPIISPSSVVGKQHENQSLRPRQKSSKAHRGDVTKFLSQTSYHPVTLGLDKIIGEDIFIKEPGFLSIDIGIGLVISA